MRKLIVRQWVSGSNIAERQNLVLVEATAFGSGVASLRYEIDNTTASGR